MKRITFLVGMLFLILTVYSQNNAQKRIYEVWDDRPADNRGADWSKITSRGYPYDADWEQQSYPIGNGYMGANLCTLYPGTLINSNTADWMKAAKVTLFEISAQWVDKKANAITINAKSGGLCRIKIPNIKSVYLKNDKGMDIDYKIVDKDIVEFSTISGSVFQLSNISVK